MNTASPNGTDKPAWVDLGYMNGWTKDPEEYTKCRTPKLMLQGAVVGRCVHQTWCDICRITYKVDSSD